MRVVVTVDRKILDRELSLREGLGHRLFVEPGLDSIPTSLMAARVDERHFRRGCPDRGRERGVRRIDRLRVGLDQRVDVQQLDKPVSLQLR
jgi:hypothetical protein